MAVEVSSEPDDNAQQHPQKRAHHALTDLPSNKYPDIEGPSRWLLNMARMPATPVLSRKQRKADKRAKSLLQSLRDQDALTCNLTGKLPGNLCTR